MILLAALASPGRLSSSFAMARANGMLEGLLRATGDHPLLSIKGDQVWGFHPHEGGRNLLAKIWERIRAELKQT